MGEISLTILCSFLHIYFITEIRIVVLVAKVNKGVTKVLKGSYMGVIQGYFKGVSICVLTVFKSVSRMLQGCYVGVTWVLQWC